MSPFLCQPNQVQSQSVFFIAIVQNSIMFCLDVPTMSNTCAIVFVFYHMCAYLFTFSFRRYMYVFIKMRLSCTYLFTCRCLRYCTWSLLSLVYLILFSLLLVLMSYSHLFWGHAIPSTQFTALVNYLLICFCVFPYSQCFSLFCTFLLISVIFITTTVNSIWFIWN